MLTDIRAEPARLVSSRGGEVPEPWTGWVLELECDQTGSFTLERGGRVTGKLRTVSAHVRHSEPAPMGDA